MFGKKLMPLITTVMIALVASQAEAKQGFYMGLGASYNTIRGDFDGSAGLDGGTEIIILPDADSAFGIDLLAGYGINDEWAIEFNFMSSEHNGTWAGLTGDLSFVSFSVNGKYSLAPADILQPYLLFGISVNALLIKDGAQDTFTLEVGDATLSGSGLNLGMGIDNYFSPNASLTLGFMYRFVDYTEADGLNQSGTIDDGVDGSGFSLLVTTAFHF